MHALLQDYSVAPLDVGQRTGGERLLLWLPMTITHVIDEKSPLFNWKNQDEALEDCDATIVVWVCSTRLPSLLFLCTGPILRRKGVMPVL